MAADVLVRARRVRLLTCDVDGVLTDGRIYVDDHGHETKAYSALDGVGIGLLQRAGITVAWITGSTAPAVMHRARRCNVAHVVLGAAEKRAPWESLRAQLGLAAEDCAHIGDDLPDLAIFHACGFAVTVPHAPPSVLEHAHFVTVRDGGAGAVRELADLILAAQGKHLDQSDHSIPLPRSA
jgi:3-deoxy-D-manno-octulosonate 8-phosphate phosphatase (KDO 8-P phosphatase)